MEGLIPMVYRAIKKSRTRRQYQRLSTVAAETYNIADFYMDGQSHMYLTSPAEKSSSFHPESNGHHRRYKSVSNFSSMDCSRAGASPEMGKPLVRFRSHRMFSCITGA